MRRLALFLVLLSAAAVSLGGACRPDDPTVVDEVEVRGWGMPVYIFELEKAQAVADEVLAAMGTAEYRGTGTDDVSAGARPYIRVSFMGEPSVGEAAMERTLLILAGSTGEITAYYRARADEGWFMAVIPPERSSELVSVVTEAAGVNLLGPYRASDEEISSVRAAVSAASMDHLLFEGDYEVISVEEVSWPDASLGCPREGEAYAQVVTPGYRVVIEVTATGERYEYHATPMRAIACGEGA